MEDRLEANWNAVRQRIRAACRAADRTPEDVELLAVTKQVSPVLAARLFELGQHALGENRQPELERKARAFEALGKRPHWHFIGPLQRNKARRVVRLCETLHSIDSPKLLGTLDRLAGELGKRPGLYLEVKLTQETAKHGFPPAEIEDAVHRAGALEHVELLGLMGMGPQLAGANDEARRRAAAECFEELGALARRMQSLHPDAFRERRARLSMGMTGDLEQAIAHGSTTVRVGTALFEGLGPEDGR